MLANMRIFDNAALAVLDLILLFDWKRANSLWVSPKTNLNHKGGI